MFKVIFRIGNEHSYVWKEVTGVFLKDHANEISSNLMRRHVFNVIVPAEDFEKNGLPAIFNFEQKVVQA